MKREEEKFSVISELIKLYSEWHGYIVGLKNSSLNRKYSRAGWSMVHEVRMLNTFCIFLFYFIIRTWLFNWNPQYQHESSGPWFSGVCQHSVLPDLLICRVTKTMEGNLNSFCTACMLKFSKQLWIIVSVLLKRLMCFNDTVSKMGNVSYHPWME